MTHNLGFLLRILALVCFLIGTINWPQGVKINVVSLGLFFWLLSTMLGGG